jgi:hypothetical protein
MSMGLVSIVALVLGAIGCISVIVLAGVAVYLLVENQRKPRD